MIFGMIGIGVSILHLGRPLQAWRAFLGFRQSWLSREIIFFGLFLNLATYHTATFWFPISTDWPRLLEMSVVVTGLIGVFCSVMVYADTRRDFWNIRLSGKKFFGSTILLGLSASVSLETILKIGGSRWTIAALILISLSKLAWETKFLFHVRDGNVSTSKQSALLLTKTLRHATITRFICGALGGIVLPAMLLSRFLNPDFIFSFAVASFALCLFGEILERYLFFTAVVAPKMPEGIS